VCRPLVILAVDDDSLVLTNTVAMLDDLGHNPIAASSGKEALDILRRENSVELVITDQLMPQMTGEQLAVAIKAEWPKLPVILATGFAETPANAWAYPRLAKPFTQAELSENLARIEANLRARAGSVNSIGGRIQDRMPHPPQTQC
jgi:CheY-like chemotaxis protein